MVLHQGAILALVEVHMDPEVAMVHHQEAATETQEAASVVLRLDGMAEDGATMAHLDRECEVHHRLDTAQIPTTDPKAVWHLLSDSDHLLINLLQEGPRPAAIWLSARLSRWTSVLAAHQMRHLIKFRLTG